MDTNPAMPALFSSSSKHGKLRITLLAGVLGNLLAFLSSSLIAVQPQIAFDLSHLATFAVALAFGPYYGLLAGALVSIYPYITFGVLGTFGTGLGLLIIVGKAMTGLTCGLLARRLRPHLAVPLSFVPESLYMFLVFKAMQAWVSPDAMTGTVIGEIMLKGWVEVLILSFVLETVVRHDIMETAVLLLEIFVITLVVHKEGMTTLAILLVMVFFIMEIVNLVQPKKESREHSPGSPG